MVDTDGEFVASVLAPDMQERLRALMADPGHVDAASAQTAIERFVAASANRDYDELRRQGDDTQAPVDFFRPVVKASRLHPGFRRLAEDRGYVPARAVIERMMRWYDDVDGWLDRWARDPRVRSGVADIPDAPGGSSRRAS